MEKHIPLSEHARTLLRNNRTHYWWPSMTTNVLTIVAMFGGVVCPADNAKPYLIILACCAGVGMGKYAKAEDGRYERVEAEQDVPYAVWRQHYKLGAQWTDFKLREQVGAFVDLVRHEVESTQAALDGLEEEIRDLQRKGDALREHEVTLDDLDQKYQKHFNNLRENADVIEETRP